MDSSLKKVILGTVLVLGAGALAFCLLMYVSPRQPVAQGHRQAPKTEHVKEVSGKPVAVSGKARHTAGGARDGAATRWPASKVYVNAKLNDVDRFHSLMSLAHQHDANARYLAYRMRENCRIAGAMAKDTVLAKLWTAEMGRALKTLNERCRPLIVDPAFQDFSIQVENLSTASFNVDIPIRIKKAFADYGATDAVSTALAAFRGRPDRATALLVAKTLASLDVLEFGPKFQLEGSAASIPAMRRDTFYAALMLHSCDFGVPCGAGSDRMLRICAIGGGCQPGQNFYQYFANTASPQDMRNIESILDVLRRAQPKPAR